MNSIILVALPDPVIRQAVWNDPRVVIFDEQGWWVRDGLGERRLRDTFSFPIDWTANGDVRSFLETVKRWSPIWTRWVTHADQYEQLYREALFYVRHLQSAFKQLGIKHLLLVTGVSHHLETSLLEVAAAEAGVRQVFLYFESITNRLLPMMQRQSIADRVPSTVRVSTYRATDDIERFRQRRFQGHRPQLTYTINRLSTSFTYGVLNAGYVRARRALGARRRASTSGADAVFFEQFRPSGVMDFVRILDTQRRALAYLNSRISQRPVTSYTSSSGKPVLLLAAHYQPEATSFPEGDDLGNHIDIVVKLRSLGWQEPILYREHFGSAYYQLPLVHQTLVGTARSVAYYRRLEQLGCEFVDYQSPLPLGNGAAPQLLPITITGTIAVERALAGVPTIVTGHPWYKGLPGTMNLSVAHAGGDLMMTPVDATIDEAFAFFERLLSGVTITNVPGLGSGAALSDAAAIRAFHTEFQTLIDSLDATATA